MASMRFVMSVIDEDTAKQFAVLDLRHLDGPAIDGRDGDLDLVCGACSWLIGSRVPVGQFTGVVLRCPKCHAFNKSDLV